MDQNPESNHNIANVRTCEFYLLPLLKKFTSNTDTRKWMASPFQVGNRTVAINGHCLLSAPFTELHEPFGYPLNDGSHRVHAVYPMQHTMNATILVAELKQKLKEFPTVDCFDETEKECEACDGEGEVDFEFYHKDRSHTMVFDCPVCDGEGTITTQSEKPSGQKEFANYRFFQIGECAFSPERIKELIYVADYLKSDVVTVSNQTESYKATLFTIKDVELLIMPVMCDNAENIIQSINIHND